MLAASAVAFWILLRSVLPCSERRWAALAMGLGLWVLAPAFLRLSLQVRTDQPAIVLGLWGGVALLSSRVRTVWALLAGILFGVGFLFTQKLVYVGGLVGALAVGQLLIRRELDGRREALRAALALASFLVVVLAYREVMRRVSTATPLLPVAGQMRVFEYYRTGMGWGYYRSMLPGLLPQVLMLGSLAIVTLDWLRARGRHGRELLAAWGVFAVGLAVTLFHAGRFPYFYMVLGLFPAAVGALITGPMLERLANGRQRAAFLGVVWLPLALGALGQTARITIDTQERQRASLAFIEQSFPPPARGFEGHGALTCRHDPDPFPVRFYMNALADFTGPDAEAHTRAMLEGFRSRPVSFMILPIPAEPYPTALRELWETRYVGYRSLVRVPGRAISGEAGWTGSFEALVPARYRWIPEEGVSTPLEVDGHALAPGDVMRLEVGVHDLRLAGGGSGMLALALAEPPAPDTAIFFTPF
jgi:hypothetical protein